jgi:hypothetical protein
MRKALIAVVAVAVLVFAGAAMAGKTGHAVPWKYDPGKTGTIVAHWTKDGLSLQKNTPTATNAAAGADIKGVEGDTFMSLSFEVKDETYCGAGAPRFNVYSASGTSFLGCIHGEQTDAGDGWTKVTFTGDEVGAAGAFGLPITGADVVMDEQGQTLLRNISVNGTSISK